ncbi:hypothetical protein C8R44DRAFT_885854 [Mycena epipterygia]|nr:hypothetical protein C8R44DRAFT_885854 [Mycena epipterygia]
MSSDLDCGNLNNPNTFFGVRVASVFVILICGTGGTLLPVLAKRFAKYFGSGVIVYRDSVHTSIVPGIDELSSPCLAPRWQEYPYALALCFLSIMSIFPVEIIAFRWGTERLKKLGITRGLFIHLIPFQL